MCWLKARIITNRRNKIKTDKSLCLLSVFRSTIETKNYTIPENPINAIAKIPAVIRAIGTPFSPLGTF